MFPTTKERSLPQILSFITLRTERFGALLFNPYLGEEEELDPVEAHIALLANGTHSCAQIEIETARRFGLSLAEARRQVDCLLRKLAGMFAVVMREAPAAPPVFRPDVPYFAPDGPYLAAPKDVIWDVTYECNLRCRHCLTTAGRRHPRELDTEQACRLVDRLAEAQVLRLSLSGGEPLLRPDILDILRYLATKRMSVEILSNGVGLKQSLLDTWRSLPVFRVQISIDGIGDEHDRLRGLPGAFQAACDSIQRLKAEGIAVSISTTVTRENIASLDRIIDLAIRLGVGGFKAIPFLPAGRGRENARELMLTPEQQLHLCETVERRAQELDGRLRVASDSAFQFLLGQPQPVACQAARMGCSAGHDILHVGADGIGHPCPFLLDFPLGSVLEQPLRELWASAPVLKALRAMDKPDLGDPCGSCKYAPALCRGGCRAAAYFEHGDLRAADPGCFRDVADRRRGAARSGPANWQHSGTGLEDHDQRLTCSGNTA